jgi:hypothetical protein
MHRARGRLARPPADVHARRIRGMTASKERIAAGGPATPEASCAPACVCHLPCLAAAYTAATATVAVSAAHHTDDVEVCAYDSQPLLSPPAHLVPKSYVCDWAQAIQCSLPATKPEPCQ